VIAGYKPSPRNFEELLIGNRRATKLVFATRTRNGFTPASRAELLKKIGPLYQECPFANLPEKKSGEWGAGLTGKMTECRWLKHQFVGQFEFLEWAGDNHPRHSKYIALRTDKKPKDVRRK
jgi:bifunctional non-homologous end joining protein LigD